MNILIFKTNISDRAMVDRVAGILGGASGVSEWSVDTEDVDCVLRVVTPTLTAPEVTGLINSAGFTCTELE